MEKKDIGKLVVCGDCGCVFDEEIASTREEREMKEDMITITCPACGGKDIDFN